MAGLDSNTKLLLHCDGTDGSTSFPDVSDNSHTVTAVATAQVDTAVKKFGTGSLMLDGNSDYLTIPDSNDFDIYGDLTTDWTIDFWMKVSEDPSSGFYKIVAHADSAQNYAIMIWYVSGIFIVNTRVGNVGKNSCSSSVGLGSSQNWHHFCFVKLNAHLAIYLDGTQIADATANATTTSANYLSIGARAITPGSENFFPGYIDEFRIQKSNFFNATPNSGKTDTITVPTEAYSSDTIIYRRNQAIIIA